MTKTVLPLTIGLLAISFLRAQEISPSPSASATPARAVRISFVPPPLEGKISLGVYNEWSQLVRVLHQEADFDAFWRKSVHDGWIAGTTYASRQVAHEAQRARRLPLELVVAPDSREPEEDEGEHRVA